MSAKDAPGPDQDTVDELFGQIVSTIEPEDTSDAWFQPLPGGRVKVCADERYLELFAGWCAQLHSQLDGPPVAPVAYEDDPLAQLAYESGAGATVASARREALERVISTVGAAELDEDTADLWLRAANDLRMLMVPDTVTSDEAMAAFYRAGTPESGAAALLGALQSYLLSALEELPHL